MFNRIIIAAFLLLSVLIYNTAESATVLIDNGSVTGIQDLSVSGNRYDVDFIFDSYENIWGTSFDFLTESQADDAATALIEFLNSTTYTDVKDGLTIKDYFLIPYAYGSSGNAIKIISFSSEYIANDWVASEFHDSSSPDGNRMYAQFTASVPIPGAFILFGSSVIGIIGIRRKRR